MRDWQAIIEALEAVPVIESTGTLARLVPFGDLLKNSPPEFLFTSGKPNRYNPAGIECVYFSEDEATARLEYARQWAKLRAGKQPVVTYFAEVRLRRVLDLSSAKTLTILKLTSRHLHKLWRGADKTDSDTVARRSGFRTLYHSGNSLSIRRGKKGRTIRLQHCDLPEQRKATGFSSHPWPGQETAREMALTFAYIKSLRLRGETRPIGSVQELSFTSATTRVGEEKDLSSRYPTAGPNRKSVIGRGIAGMKTSRDFSRSSAAATASFSGLANLNEGPLRAVNLEANSRSEL